MKTYSINTSVRRTVVVVLLGLSYFAARIINHLLIAIDITEVSPFLQGIIADFELWGFSATSFSLITVFGFAYLLYCKCLWKISFIQKLHGIPDLNGKWEGKLISTWKNEDGSNTVLDMCMEIKQDWTQLSAECTFLQSSSYNFSAFIHVDGNGGIDFGFPYVNEASTHEFRVNRHDGFNEFRIKGDSMNGRYFTNRESGTQGDIKLHRKRSVDTMSNEKLSKT